MDIHAKPPSTYIGSVPFVLALPPASDDPDNTSSTPLNEESQSVIQPKPLHYALSSTAYPLINFAPPPRPGSLTNGSFPLSEDLPERDQLLPYLLDPPAEDLSVQQANGLEMSDAGGLTQKPVHNRGWLLWVLGVISALAVCIAAITGYGWRSAIKVKQATTPPPIDERTPLLPLQEDKPRVTFKEPQRIETESSLLENEKRETSIILEEDDQATPKKKSTRRRVRGKKKPKDGSGSGLSGKEGEDDDNEEDSSGSPKSGEKPLPELPRVVSSVALLDDTHEKERLVISDSVIGTFL